MYDLISRMLFGEGGLLKVRALLAFGLIGIAGYMWVNEIPIGEHQETLTTMVAAFYFATRAAQAVNVAGAVSNIVRRIPGIPPVANPTNHPFSPSAADRTICSFCGEFDTLHRFSPEEFASHMTDPSGKPDIVDVSHLFSPSADVAICSICGQSANDHRWGPTPK